MSSTARFLRRTAVGEVDDREEYPAIGVPDLDDEHRALAQKMIRLINAVRDDDAALAGLELTALIDGATAHFAHEEHLMEEIAYAAFARHAATHRLFLAAARRWLTELRARGVTGAFLRWLSQNMAWFNAHVWTEDIPLAHALLSARLDQAAGSRAGVPVEMKSV